MYCFYFLVGFCIMGRVKDISNEKKIEIATLLKLEQFSIREIARRSKVSAATVSRISKNIEAGLSPRHNKRKNCRRLRKTSERTNREIIRKASLQRRTPVRVLTRELNEQGVDVSAVTVRRRFYEANLKCRRPAKKPKLTANMKKKRLHWAKLHESFTIDDWKKVIFSDECRLEAVTEAANFIRRRPNERFKEDCLIRTVKHPPATMIWSCITGEGPGPLYFVEGTMRAEQYKRALETVLLPYMDSLPSSGSSYTFMQDGAPCHTAKSLKDFFSSQNIDVLPWPGNSPDLNPIENCWAFLKSKVYSLENNTINNLKRNIEQIWKNDEEIKKMVNSCIESMPNRIKEVIKAKGETTKY